MKSFKYLFVLPAVLLAACTLMAGQVPVQIVAGGYGTNSAQILMNSVTNQTGVVKGAATNSYNMPVVSGASSSSYAITGASANTNLWPPSGFAMIGGYPGTLYGPVRQVTIFEQFSIMATNAGGTQNVVVRWAGGDGYIWQSNYLVQTLAIPANQTVFSTFVTNNDTLGMPYLALQSLENTNVTALTNVIIDATAKPGF